jgi:hypothetical protein
MMTTLIFPSEALILGLSVGEFDHTGKDEPRGSFLATLRNRVLPLIPSLVAQQHSPGRPKYDLSRSLFDIILDDLRQSVAFTKAEQRLGFGSGLEIWEHFAGNIDAIHEQIEFLTGEEQTERADFREMCSRNGRDDSQAIERYLRSLAAASGYELLFDVGRAFGCVAPEFDSARTWLQQFAVGTHSDDEEISFCLGDYLSDRRLEELEKILSKVSLARDLIAVIQRHRDREFSLYPSSYYNACQLVSDMSAAFWQAFGIVLGEVREQDEFARREESKRPLSRELLLGAQVSDDRIAEAIRNAQDLVRASRGTPAVAVSQLAFAVEACIKRVCRTELAMPNATVGGAIEQCRRSTDERMKKFGNIASTLREVYRHDATHESDELEVSWAEATFFVTGVQVLFELSKVLAA